MRTLKNKITRMIHRLDDDNSTLPFLSLSKAFDVPNLKLDSGIVELHRLGQKGGYRFLCSEKERDNTEIRARNMKVSEHGPK
jgi:hypothetical protein